MRHVRTRAAAMVVVALCILGLGVFLDRPSWLGVDWFFDDSTEGVFPGDSVGQAMPPPGYDVDSSLWGPLICPTESSVEQQQVGSVESGERLDDRDRHAALVAAQEYVADTFAASAPIREARLYVVNRPHGDAVLADRRVDPARILGIGAAFTVARTPEGVAVTGALFCSDFVGPPG